jgi:hypothetical protein
VQLRWMINGTVTAIGHKNRTLECIIDTFKNLFTLEVIAEV